MYMAHLTIELSDPALRGHVRPATFKTIPTGVPFSSSPTIVEATETAAKAAAAKLNQREMDSSSSGSNNALCGGLQSIVS